MGHLRESARVDARAGEWRFSDEHADWAMRPGERREGGAMSHRHFCHVAGHWWECNGSALRSGDTEPSVCICLPCGRPLEGYDHSGCNDPVELLACPEHVEEERREVGEARKRCGGGAAGPGPEGADAAPAEEVESPVETAPEQAARSFERFPLVPIGPGDPLYCAEYCNCGCRRMPPELSGGFCLHCGHVYQRNDPEFWLGSEYPHSQDAHTASCAAYREYAKKADEGLAKFHAMIKGADEETFGKLLSACYSKAIDDNYEAYMSAPEGSPERAAIAEKIALAHAKETEASDLPDHLKQEIRSGQVVPVAPPSGTHMAKEHLKKG
jgi:hypothetical protein